MQSIRPNISPRQIVLKAGVQLPGPADTLAKQVDDVAFGLPGVAEDKQVLAGQQGDGNEFHKFLALHHKPAHVVHDGEHFISERHNSVHAAFSLSSTRCINSCARLAQLCACRGCLSNIVSG
jgi:hypothetical protein